MQPDEWDAKARRIKDRIDNATRMYHNAHDHWSSEHFAPGVSYLDWIHAAVDDLAAFGRAAEQRGIERAAKVADQRADKIMKQADVDHDEERYDAYEEMECQATAISEVADAIRALAQPAGASDKEG